MIVNVIKTYKARYFKVMEVQGDNELDLDNVKNKYKQK